MKRNIYIIVALAIATLFFTASCSIKTDDLEDSIIYTTVYPINYLTNYLYDDYAKIESIYPNNCDLDKFKLTNKKKNEYAKADLFIYNGLTEEKKLAKELINRNGDLLIIDVSKGLKLENDTTELWLSPNNYLMLAKNIKTNLSEYIESKYIIEEIDNKFNDFQEKISVIDAALHSIGKDATANGKNIIITSNDTFKFLEKYGFEVISIEHYKDMKDTKINSIKNNFSSGKYKYIISANTDKDNKLTKELIDKYKAEKIDIDTLTFSLTGDYFDIMTAFTETIKKAVS